MQTMQATTVSQSDMRKDDLVGGSSKKMQEANQGRPGLKSGTVEAQDGNVAKERVNSTWPELGSCRVACFGHWKMFDCSMSRIGSNCEGRPDEADHDETGAGGKRGKPRIRPKQQRGRRKQKLLDRVARPCVPRPGKSTASEARLEVMMHGAGQTIVGRCYGRRQAQSQRPPTEQAANVGCRAQRGQTSTVHWAAGRAEQTRKHQVSAGTRLWGRGCVCAAGSGTPGA